MEGFKEFFLKDKKYTIITRIYNGEFSKVYLAEEQTTKEKYAIKIVNNNSDFEKEVSILIQISELHNPYIINIKDYGEESIKKNSLEKRKYIILEYASKRDIFDYIKETNIGLEEIYAKFIFNKILNGVKAIHQAGFCHRDLKMNNILVDEYFNPKICDFGFATEIQDENGPKRLTDYLGTPNYAAPEMYEGKPYDGIKADIFSLGVILLNIVACQKGFIDAKHDDLYYKYIIQKKYNDYWDIVDEYGKIPKQVKDLYIKMIAYEPDERPSIEKILSDPWMKEIKDLNEEGKKKLEKKVYEKFVELDKEVSKKNETLNTNKNFEKKIDIESNKGLSDNEKEYFNLLLSPKYILKTGLNMKYYLKINGNINPVGFMNSLANKIQNEYGDKIKIEENKQKLKFNVIFENSEEFEIGKGSQKEKNEKLKEEINNIIKENSNSNDIENDIERKKSIIQIKLFESSNGGYVVKFDRNQGEIEDFLKHLDNLKNLIKNML